MFYRTDMLPSGPAAACDLPRSLLTCDLMELTFLAPVPSLAACRQRTPVRNILCRIGSGMAMFTIERTCRKQAVCFDSAVAVVNGGLRKVTKAC